MLNVSKVLKPVTLVGPHLPPRGVYAEPLYIALDKQHLRQSTRHCTSPNVYRTTESCRGVGVRRGHEEATVTRASFTCGHTLMPCREVLHQSSHRREAMNCHCVPEERQPSPGKLEEGLFERVSRMGGVKLFDRLQRPARPAPHASSLWLLILMQPSILLLARMACLAYLSTLSTGHRKPGTTAASKQWHQQ